MQAHNYDVLLSVLFYKASRSLNLDVRVCMTVFIDCVTSLQGREEAIHPRQVRGSALRHHDVQQRGGPQAGAEAGDLQPRAGDTAATAR